VLAFLDARSGVSLEQLLALALTGSLLGGIVWAVSALRADLAQRAERRAQDREKQRQAAEAAALARWTITKADEPPTLIKKALHHAPTYAGRAVIAKLVEGDGPREYKGAHAAQTDESTVLLGSFWIDRAALSKNPKLTVADKAWLQNLASRAGALADGPSILTAIELTERVGTPLVVRQQIKERKSGGWEDSPDDVRIWPNAEVELLNPTTERDMPLLTVE
jgi:hypothetical protein